MRPVKSSFACSAPAFVQRAAGRPKSYWGALRPNPNSATESGAVTHLGHSGAEHAVFHGVDGVAAPRELVIRGNRGFDRWEASMALKIARCGKWAWAGPMAVRRRPGRLWRPRRVSFPTPATAIGWRLAGYRRGLGTGIPQMSLPSIVRTLGPEGKFASWSC